MFGVKLNNSEVVFAHTKPRHTYVSTTKLPPSGLIPKANPELIERTSGNFETTKLHVFNV